MNEKNYIGKWLNVSTEKEIIVKAVDKDSRQAITNDGLRISLAVLDLSGDYEKISRPDESPEIANEIKAQARAEGLYVQEKTVQPIVTDAITKKPPTNTPQKTEEQVSVKIKENTGSNDPSDDLISAAIKISSKRKETTEMAVTIKFTLPFDVLKIINTCKDLGLDDSQILDKIMSFVHIDNSTVIESIKNELLYGDEDDLDNQSDTVASISDAHKEESEKALTEELKKYTYDLGNGKSLEIDESKFKNLPKVKIEPKSIKED